jgi:hypothetical protein
MGVGGEVLRELARMGGVIMSHGCVTVKEHEFIQHVYLDGHGNIAQHKIEQAMGFAKRGAEHLLQGTGG